MADLKPTIQELLRALRGSLSQNQLNRRLGYDFNQVSRWEGGYTAVPWPDFVRICSLRKVPLAHALRTQLAYFGRLGDSAALVRHLVGQNPVAEVSARTGYSKHVLTGWMQGRSVPRLEAVFHIVRDLQNGLLEVLQLIVNPVELPSLRSEFERKHRQKDLYYDEPIVAAVVYCFDLEEYRRKPEHEEGFVARRCGISVEEERALIQKLLEVGMIRRQGRHYEMSCRDLELSGRFEGALRARRYWTDRFSTFMASLRERPQHSMMGLYTYSASEESSLKIREAHQEFLSRLDEIVRADTAPKQRVLTQAFWLLDMDEFTKTRPPLENP